jgi:hypothetical protein
MVVEFISRQEKASWGIPCNQSANGKLWVGKGYVCLLAGQFGPKNAAAIAGALARGRHERNGRFWVNLEKQDVTMAIGNSADNRYAKETF